METRVGVIEDNGKKKGSYPTYEEWKRVPACKSRRKASVLILPMRNGNHNFSI